ncbi:hypothetical protein VOLCADRAFT_87281 [Volvox carteri f. nagariensis]|uniref:Protein kinase domain-containing protein n=1 Tax=Volvox carteri f. nagariensis TaxID=3068 RepID=D8TKX5_VOLCA|nr:uncharacterized protein VOLCADRAFT_87281 [Volvox carteri f. nagariensis]EFJ51772.1 hypothetical protein VOLCADRAFT_87281 [Volvox carteri f. nagariensis]|eukprot:XP_002947182.1 hypothetical protein VOLCADRAFT_87281 [Volvox carteri f. nagariensis]
MVNENDLGAADTVLLPSRAEELPSWLHELGRLRSKLIGVRGAPIRRIAEGANLLAELLTAGAVSIFGFGGAEFFFSDTPRWTVLHSAGAAAAALPPGLQVPALCQTEAGRLGCVLEIRVPEFLSCPQRTLTTTHTATREKVKHGKTARRLWGLVLPQAPKAELPLPAAPPKSSRLGQSQTTPDGQSPATPLLPSPLPVAWRHLLHDLALSCPAPRWRAVLLPLGLDGRHIGALLLLLPAPLPLQQQEQQPPRGATAWDGAQRGSQAVRIGRAAGRGGTAFPANSGNFARGGDGGDGGGGGSGCADGSFGQNRGGAGGDVSLLESGLLEMAECVAECCLGPALPVVEQVCLAADALSSSVSLQDLAALLTGSMASLLAAELHLEMVVRLALLPTRDSPTGLLFYAPPADRTASKSGASPQSPRCTLQGPATATTTSATATPTTTTTTNATHNAAAAAAGGSVYSTQPSGSFALGSSPLLQSSPQQHYYQQQLQGHQHHQHRLGMVTGSSERPLAADQGATRGGGQHNGRRIVVALPGPAGGRDGGYCSVPSGPAGLGSVAGPDDDPSGTGFTPCQSTADNALALSWAPFMVSQGTGSVPGAAGGAGGGGGTTAGPAWVTGGGVPAAGASPFATSSTLLTALLHGKIGEGPGGALPPPPPPGTPVAMGGASSYTDGGGSGGAVTGPFVQLRSTLVPDVPTWLQDATQPSGDAFSLVRRAGVAGGLASLIALVMEPLADNVAIAGVTATDAVCGAVVPSQQPRQRAATGPQPYTGGGAGRTSGISSSNTATVGLAAATAAASPMRTSWLGPRRERSSCASVEGFDSVFRTAAAGGAGSGSAAATAGSSSLGTAVLGLYLYSSLPLPQSFLQAARERALDLLQVLAPVALRCLHTGPLADEWACLWTQVMGGGPQGAAQWYPSLVPASSIGLGPAAAVAPLPRAPEGAAAVATDPLALAVRADASSSAASTMTGMAGAAATAAMGMEQGAASRSITSAGGRQTHGSLSSNSSPAVTVTGTVTTGAVTTPMPFQTPPPSRKLVSSHTIPRRSVPHARRASAVANPAIPLETPAAAALACRVISTSGAALPSAGSTGCDAMLPAPAPTVFVRAPDCGLSEPYDTALFSSSGIVGDVMPPGDGTGAVAAAQDLGLMAAGGLGSGFTGGVTAPGFESEWPSSMTLLTHTVSDLGPVARQQNMATLVTAFTTTLSRARTDTEQMGGAHAEDDIRNLRILRAIGLGGCSVVVLARLHAMPVAVKVILPLEDEEEGTAAGEAGKDVAPLTATAGDPVGTDQQQQQEQQQQAPYGRSSYKSLMSTPWAAVVAGEGGSDGEAGRGKSLRAGVRAQRLNTAKRRSRLQALMRGARELAVLTTISHPNIVQVYSYCTRVVIREEGQGVVKLEVQPEGAPALDWRMRGPAAGGLKAFAAVFLLTEYCDMGSLADCIDTGAFARAARAAATILLRQQQPQPNLNGNSSGPCQPVSLPLPPPNPSANSTAGSPAMCAVYLTLVEVALALRHLHSLNLVHCDVKPANVLLRSSATDPRGFTAKLTDFGFVNLVARSEDAASAAAGGGRSGEGGLASPGAAESEPVGTVTHMAPELLQGSPLDPSADIYSFGILMWEVYTGRAPYSAYAENGFAAVPHKVLHEGMRPKFPPDTPSHFKSLAVSCWSSDASQRPSASELASGLGLGS